MREHRGPFDACLWTVVSKTLVPESLDPFLDDDMAPYPALPLDVLGLADAVVSKLEFLTDNITSIMCNTSHHKLYCYPPGIPKDRLEEFPDAHNYMKINSRKFEGYQSAFVPIGISVHNVGSNVGLVEMFAELIGALLYDEDHVGKLKTCWVLSDLNIFNRLFKVHSCCSCSLYCISWCTVLTLQQKH